MEGKTRCSRWRRITYLGSVSPRAVRSSPIEFEGVWGAQGLNYLLRPPIRIPPPIEPLKFCMRC